jgi:hypothetical protein
MFSASQIESLGFNTANMLKKSEGATGFTSKGLSAFQILLSSMIEAHGDMDKIPKKFKGALRCSVKETSPNFLVTDGSYFISAYFTEDSYKQFRSENGALRVTDL